MNTLHGVIWIDENTNPTSNLFESLSTEITRYADRFEIESFNYDNGLASLLVDITEMFPTGCKLTLKAERGLEYYIESEDFEDGTAADFAIRVDIDQS